MTHPSLLNANITFTYKEITFKQMIMSTFVRNTLSSDLHLLIIQSLTLRCISTTCSAQLLCFHGAHNWHRSRGIWASPCNPETESCEPVDLWINKDKELRFFTMPATCNSDNKNKNKNFFKPSIIQINHLSNNKNISGLWNVMKTYLQSHKHIQMYRALS